MTREQFYAVRRLYRLAHKLSPMQSDQAVRLMMESTHTMRAITGQWDVCDPLRWPSGRLPGGRLVWVSGHWVWKAASTFTGRQFFRRQ